MSAKPYDFLVDHLEEEIEYLVLIIDFAHVTQVHTQNCSYSMTGVEGYPKILKIIKRDGWSKNTGKKDPDVSGRYRHYFRRFKIKRSKD